MATAHSVTSSLTISFLCWLSALLHSSCHLPQSLYFTACGLLLSFYVPMLDSVSKSSCNVFQCSNYLSFLRNLSSIHRLDVSSLFLQESLPILTFCSHTPAFLSQLDSFEEKKNSLISYCPLSRLNFTKVCMAHMFKWIFGYISFFKSNSHTANMHRFYYLFYYIPMQTEGFY